MSGEEVPLKLAWFKKPRLYVLAGLVGLVLCALLVYIAEYKLAAPNESTLLYRQSQWVFSALILSILSIAALGWGVWGIVQERRAKQLGK